MRSVLTLLLLVSMLVIAVTDLVTPRGFAHGTLYLLPLACAYLTGSERLLRYSFLAALLLLWLGAWASPPGEVALGYVLSNRITSTLVLLGFWGLLHWALVREEAFERIQQALARLGLGIFATDASGRLRWRNEAMAGLKQEDLPQVLSAEGAEQSAEIRSVLDNDGNARDLRRRLRAIRDEDGRVRGYVGVIENITPGDVWQQTLSEVRVGHASVLESISESILAVDDRWRVTYLNAAAETLLGHTRKEMLGRTLEELFPEVMASPIGAGYRQAFDVGEMRRIEAYFQRIDAWLDVRVYPHPQGATFIFRDVTDERALRVKMEEAVRESREQALLLRSVIDGLTDGMVVVDRDLNVLLENAPAQRLLGAPEDRSEAESAGDRQTVYLSDEVTPVPAEEWPLARALAGEVIDEARVFLRNRLRPDGLPLRISARPLKDTQDEIIGAIAWFRDISEQVAAEATRREIEEELRHAQRLEAMGQLTGGVAHDFNNLLTVIVGNADLLVGAPGLDEDAEESAGMILAAAEKASRLVQQLLAFSRRQPLSPVVFDPVERLANFLPLLQRTLGETIDLRLIGEQGRMAAIADPTQLESAVLNLCVNARDAMPDGGEVRIEVATTELSAADDLPTTVSPGAYVSVRVDDEGHGMPEEVIERAFEPFFTTKEVGHGSGLGLSMVFGFVRQSNGHLRLESEVDSGTRIEMLLPLADADPSNRNEDQATPAAVTSTARERVLVVEDDPMVCDLIRITLEELGYRAHMARNGDQALELAAGGVDVLLTDLVLPGRWNGISLAEELRARQPGLKVLVMTGYGTAAQIRTGEEALLSKPFRRAELAARLREVLAE